MLTTCNKCGSQKEVKLRKSDSTPVCVECGSEVPLSKIMVENMKRSNDYVTMSDNKVPFGCKCDKCGAIAELIFNSTNNEAECTICHKTMNITPFMVKALQLSGHYHPAKDAVVSLDEKEEGKKNVPGPSKQTRGAVSRKSK